MENDLENATQPSDFDVLLSLNYIMVNPVFVDCTSAESVAGLYARALKEGCSMGYAKTKKANTRELVYYNELRQMPKQASINFMKPM